MTQLFPEGHVIDLHPWEYNEVPVVLGAALAQAAPIVALHLTRPPIELPDRAALGMPSHFEAARGAYVLRDFRPGQPAMGTVFVQGTTSTANLVKLLPELDREGLNVKVVAAISPQLFRLQPADYRARTVTPADRIDGMAITNRAARLMRDWVDGPLALEYSMGSDWDDRWRTGGSVDEVMDEAHLTPPYPAGRDRAFRARARVAPAAGPRGARRGGVTRGRWVCRLTTSRLPSTRSWVADLTERSAQCDDLDSSGSSWMQRSMRTRSCGSGRPASASRRSPSWPTPSLIPANVRAALEDVGPDDAHPLNLFRVHWYNDDARGAAWCRCPSTSCSRSR